MNDPSFTVDQGFDCIALIGTDREEWILYQHGAPQIIFLLFNSSMY